MIVFKIVGVTFIVCLPVLTCSMTLILPFIESYSLLSDKRQSRVGTIDLQRLCSVSSQGVERSQECSFDGTGKTVSGSGTRRRSHRTGVQAGISKGCRLCSIDGASGCSRSHTIATRRHFYKKVKENRTRPRLRARRSRFGRSSRGRW